MRHAYIVLFDTALRGVWYGQGRFGLSAGLHASARRKTRKQQELFA